MCSAQRINIPTHPDMLPLITHILPTLSPYGAERVAVELAARLPAHGFRTRVLVLFENGPLQQELRARGVRWAMLAPSAVRSFSGRMATVRRLHTRLFGEPERVPDIVHTHLFGADFWSSVARLIPSSSAIRPAAYLSTAHSVDQDDGAVRRVARRWAARRMTRVVAISQDVARYVQQDLSVPAARITCIPNGIALDQVRSRGPRPFRDVPRLLMVGRLEAEKGHERVFQALAGVAAPWRLDIAGDGRLLRTLKEAAERLGIASRVHFLGRREDIPALLADADLFLFPSQWEGMGLALVEAMAAGVPVLASDLPALREFAPRHSLLPLDNPVRWQEAITTRLMESSAAVAEAHALAPTIRARYDIENMIKAYAALYHSLLRT
jgi:glycosyltransferase involved in cell wall biosynthesis